MNFPEDLKYTKDHEWVKLMDDSTVIVGITDFAQKELGDIVYIDIMANDKNLSAEEVFGTIEAVKTVSDLFMPVAGRIIEINDLLNNNPELVNTDPYKDGWMIKIKIDNMDDINALAGADAYKKMVG